MDNRMYKSGYVAGFALGVDKINRLFDQDVQLVMEESIATHIPFEQLKNDFINGYNHAIDVKNYKAK